MPACTRLAPGDRLRGADSCPLWGRGPSLVGGLGTPLPTPTARLLPPDNHTWQRRSLSAAVVMPQAATVIETSSRPQPVGTGWPNCPALQPGSSSGGDPVGSADLALAAAHAVLRWTLGSRTARRGVPAPQALSLSPSTGSSPAWAPPGREGAQSQSVVEGALYMERTKTQQQTEMTGLSPSRRRYLWRVHSQQQSMKTQLWPLRSGPLLMTRWHQTCNKDRCVKSLIVVHLSRKIYIPYPHLKELLITLYSICIKLVSVNSVALQYL